MNSVKLREEHQESYRKFFEEFEIVTAANYSMPWSNELIDHASKFPLVRSKLPLRCYVWVRRVSEIWAKLTWLDSYVWKGEGFSRAAWSDLLPSLHNAEAMISERLENSSFEGGIEIWALCEIPRGRSIGFTETVNSALAYAIETLLTQGETGIPRSSDELDDDKKRELINFAWALSMKPRSWNTMAQGIRNSFSSFEWPVAYFWEEFCEGGVDLSKVRLWDRKLSENSDIATRLPIDVWIVYSWLPGDSESIEEIKQSDAFEKERLGSFLRDISRVRGVEGKTEEIIIEWLGYAAFRDVKKHLNYRGMELIERMWKFWWADDSLTGRFIGNLNNSRALLSMISEQGTFARTMHEEIRRNCDVEIGITPLYSGKYGGSYLVVSEKWSARNAVETAVREKNAQFPWMEILYSNYEDWTSSQSVEILKNQKGNRRAKGKRILFLDSFWNRSHCGYLEAISRKEGEILFDSISKKVYFNGKRLTSKEIPSQNAASDLFEILIERIGSEIPNKSLPASSYSQNKNEMVSKIISPLMKFARTHTNDELNVSCSWSLTEFRIMLERSNIRLWLIKQE